MTIAVRILCGAKGGRCGRLLAEVHTSPDGLALVANNRATVKSAEVPERQWRTHIPTNLDGGTPFILDCPKHDPDSFIHRPDWFRDDHSIPPIPAFPFALLRESLSQWRSSGSVQTLRWDRHH